MPLAELRIQNLRCVEAAALEFSPELNLISGANGAGKTSILEAVFLLGRGRSFRTRISEKLIRHGQPSLTVFGRTDDSPRCGGGCGGRRGWHPRAHQRKRRRVAARAFGCAACSVHRPGDPQDHRARSRATTTLAGLAGVPRGTNLRYPLVSVSARIETTQRRPARWKLEVSTWDPGLVEHGDAMTLARQNALGRLEPYLRALFERFAGLEVSVGFQAGWGQEHSLEEALRANSSRDLERGNDHRGAASGGCGPSPEGQECPGDAVTRPAKADGRCHDRCPIEAAAGRERHASDAAPGRPRGGTGCQKPGAFVRRIGGTSMPDDCHLVEPGNHAFSST